MSYLSHGLPPTPPAFLVPPSFGTPDADARLTIYPDVALVPVRSLLAAALTADSGDRDVVWAELPATPRNADEVWSSLRGAVAAASGLTLAGDPYDAVSSHLAARTRPVLLVVTLRPGVSQDVDARLLALLDAAPQLSLAAICSGRRALEGLGRVGYDARITSPRTMVHDGASIRSIADRLGIAIDAAEADMLAATALMLPDLLPAVMGSISPELLEGRSDSAAVILGETEYLLGLRFRTATDAALTELLPLAVPSTLSAATLTRVTQGALDDRTLDRAAQAGIVRRVDGTADFRLEQTLRRTLLAELRDRMPDSVRELDSALGHELLDSHELLAAIAHFTHAEDWDAAIDAIDSAALDMLGEHTGLHSVILGLPRRVRDENPRLSLLLELGWQSDDDLRSRAHLTTTRKAAAALMRLPDVMSPWDRLHACLTRTIVSRLRGDVSVALDAAGDLDDLLESDAIADRPVRTLAEAHYQSGMTRLLSLDLVGARESFTRSAMLANGLDDADDRPATRAAEATALTRALEGEAEQAAARLDLLESGTLGTAGLVARALISIGKLDARDARHWLARLADLAAGDEFWVFAVHAFNRYGLYWGDPVETDADLDRTWAEHGEQLVAGSTAHVLLTSDAADLALLLGQLSRAESALDQCTVRNTWISVTRARLALLAGNPKHALLFILEGQGRGRTERYGQLDLAVLRAAAELALGRTDDATASLLRAVNQAEKSGVIVPFHLLPVETLAALAALHPDAATFVATHELRGTSYLAPYQAVAGALSERELVVLRALDPDATIEQIAKKLFVASNTVKAQLRSIYRKLNVSTRTEALLVAAELGLLGEDSRSA